MPLEVWTPAPTVEPSEATDWIEETAPAGEAFDLTAAAKSDGADVAMSFLTVLQDTSLTRDQWLSKLEDLVRDDAFATVRDAAMTANDFTLGKPTAVADVETFDTGRILGVTVTTATGSVYVMLSRDTAAEPWHVAWWE